MLEAPKECVIRARYETALTQQVFNPDNRQRESQLWPHRLQKMAFTCIYSPIKLATAGHPWSMFFWHSPSSGFPWSFLCQFSLHGPVSDGCRLNQGDGQAIVVCFTETEAQRE